MHLQIISYFNGMAEDLAECLSRITLKLPKESKYLMVLNRNAEDDNDQNNASNNNDNRNKIGMIIKGQ